VCKKALQVLGKILGARVASLGIALQGLQADRLELARDAGLKATRRHGVGMRNARHQGVRRVGFEGAPQRQHLVEQDAEAEDVAARIEFSAAAGLLRAHVVGCAREVAGP
jgi:hypothetical protein